MPENEKNANGDGLGRPYEIDEINCKRRWVTVTIDAGLLGSLAKQCITVDPTARKLGTSIQSLGHNLLNAGDVIFGKVTVEDRHPTLRDVLIVDHDGNEIEANVNAT